jgi:hypothetical protein
LLATAFIDEGIEAQWQYDPAGSTTDEKTQTGLFVPLGQHDIADLTDVLPGGNQRNVNALV